MTALIAPRFVEWNNYRQQFELQAGIVLGQKVEVLGTAKARLLPLPSIEFTNVRVGGRENGEAMMVVDLFRVDAELAPLLKGEIVIVDMELQNPRINISVGENGVVDWTSRQTGVVNPEDVLLERVTIKNGSIRLHNIATDQSFEAEKVNLTMSARSLAGPWKIDGDLVLNGEKAAIRVTTGQLRDNGLISTRLNIQLEDHPYNLQLDGPIGMIDGTLDFKGKFLLKAVQDKKSTAGRPGRTFPYSSLPIRIDGRFDAIPNAIKIPEFVLAIGQRDDPYVVNGSAQAAFGERSLFKVVAEGQQIDVDRLGKLTDANGAPPSMGKRLSVLKNIINQIPLPPVEGLISLYLPAIVAGDTVIREVGVDILPKKNGWQLSNFEAGLPGRTVLQAHGLLSIGDNFGFDGQLLLASKQPSGFAGWLKGEVDEAIRKLPNAGFSAKAVITENWILLQKLEVVLGKSRLNGSFEQLSRPGERPSMAVALDGNQIDFETLRAIFLLFVSDQQGSKIADHDMDIKILADNLTVFGTLSKSVAAAVRLTDGQMIIDQLEIGDLAGASISVKGTINNALNQADGELEISIKAERPRKLLVLLRDLVGEIPFLDNLIDQPVLVSGLELTASVITKNVANGSGLEMALIGQAGGTEIDANLQLQGALEKLGSSTGTLKVSLANVRPHVLAAQLSIPVLPLDLDGDMNVTVDFAGSMKAGIDTQFDMSIGQARLTGKGEIDRIDGNNYRNRFDFLLDVPDIAPLLMLSGYAFPGMLEAGSAKISANFTSIGSLLSFNNIEGSLAGQEIHGKFTLDRKARPRIKLDGSLALDNLPLGFLAGLVMGEIEPAVESGWSNAPFTQASLRGLDGNIKLTAKTVDLATGSLGYAQYGSNLVADLQLNNGDLALKNASLDWLGGKVEGEIAFTSVQKGVLFSSKVKLVGGKLPGLVWQVDGEPVIQGRIDGTANFEGSGNSIAEIVADLSGGGAISVKDGAIRQIDPAALSSIMRVVDTRKDVDQVTLSEQLVDDSLFDQAFEFEQSSSAFSISGGNLRASNLVARTKDAELSGDMRIDLEQLVVDASARLLFNAGEDELTGATPVIEYTFKGPLAAPTVERSSELLASFLTMRVRERKEREYEAQKEEILENQRLTRMVTLTNYRIRERQKMLLQLETQFKLEQQARQQEEELLKSLEEAEEKVRQARLAMQQRQRQADEKRRQDALIDQQKRLEEAAELQRQKDDLVRRQKAFEALLLEQQETNRALPPIQPQSQYRPEKAPALAPAREVQPVGRPVKSAATGNNNLPGVFDSIEDQIGELLRQQSQ